MNTKTTTRHKDYWSPIANNPRDNELYIDKKDELKDKKFNKDNTIYASTQALKSKIQEIYGGKYGYRQTATGRRRERDEPDETTQLKQADALHKQMVQQKAAAGRERLKKKGAVPVKATSGKKLFETFIKEASKNRKNEVIDDADLRNIYNAATQLSYDKWLEFVADEYTSKI